MSFQNRARDRTFRKGKGAKSFKTDTGENEKLQGFLNVNIKVNRWTLFEVSLKIEIPKALVLQ